MCGFAENISGWVYMKLSVPCRHYQLSISPASSNKGYFEVKELFEPAGR